MAAFENNMLLFTCGIIFLFCGGAYAEKTVGVLLEEATYQEETVGDVNAAIGIYEKVIADDEARRPEVARATYRAGMCYLKKGDKDKAAQLFNDVVTKFADQKVYVTKAQAELKKLGQAPAGEQELAYDDGKQAGKWSYAGGGHAVKFKAPSKECFLQAVKIYGSRYGEYEVPKENFSVWLCDKNFQSIKQFEFPYSNFSKRGLATWVTLPTERIEVPDEFIICVGFDPHQTKGIYMYHDAEGTGNSYSGLPGSEFEPFKNGDWMIRAVVSCATRTNSDPVQVISTLFDSFEEGGETPVHWEKGSAVPGVEYIWDKNTASDGKASLCLKKTENKYFPIAQWTRKEKYDGQAAAIEISVNAKAENVTKAIVDALFLDKDDKWIKHEWVSYIGAREAGDPPVSHDVWKKYSDKVEIPSGTATVVFGLQIYGPGTIWFDEFKAKFIKTTKEDKLEAENLTTQGWQLWKERKLAEAEAAFKKAIEKNPQAEGAYQGLGWAQLNQGKKLNAEESFKKCVELNPQNSAALNGLGWIAKGQGKTDEAIGWWKKAVEATPGATAALNGLTQTYMELKKYDEAIKYYEMWLAVEPENSQAKIGLEKAKSHGFAKVDATAIQDLIKEMHNDNAPRFVALNALIDIGEPAVEPLITDLAKSNDWQTAKALGAIKDKRAIEPLLKKWETSNASPMKDVIAESLELITGQKFGTDKAKWDKWWDENGSFITPEKTIQSFMAAAAKLDTKKAMEFVATDSHDYNDIKKTLMDSSNPFNLLYQSIDQTVLVKFVNVNIKDTMCEAKWQVTLKKEFTIEGHMFKAGDAFELDGNLHKYDDKWLITGI